MPQSDVPGEKTSPTQPFPTKPPAYARNYLKVPDDLIDFTPELRAQALERAEAIQVGDRRRSRRRSSATSTASSARIGAGTATNWPGSAADPETHIVYRAGGQHGRRARSLVAPPPGFSDIRYVSGHRRTAVPRGARTRRLLRGRCAAAADRRRRRRRRPPARPRQSAGDRRRRPDRARAADRQAAVRRALGDQSRSRRADVAGAARRHAGQHPQSSRAEGHEHSEDRPGRARRASG